MIKKFASILILFLFLAPCVSFAQTKVASDPTRIGVGARILGMGKSYVGVADDVSGIFIDPAALAELNRWQLTSMQGKFINEYEYLNFGVAVPTELGCFGIGYVGSNISFTGPASTIEVLDGVRIIPASGEGISYSFVDAVYLLSWGKKLEGLAGLAFMDNISVGATLKFYQLDLSGPGITAGKGTGNDMDVGLNYEPNPIFKTGLVLQNALPFSAGGKIKWDDSEESLPSLLKAGMSLRLLGKEGWHTIGDHELRFNLDMDYAPRRDYVPVLWHFGLEWSPIELIAIRTGIDQDYVGSEGTKLEPTNNFTAGVGLLVGDFRFDYAYHQYNQVTQNDTHYFSLSYGVGKKEKEEEAGPYFEITPKDKSIVFDEKILVKVNVLNKDITRVGLDGIEAPVIDNRVQGYLPLDLGKNLLKADGYDRSGKLIDEQKIRILRLLKFVDVADDYWAAVPISILAMENVITGYPDKTFRPEGEITRAELCTLLIKSLRTQETAQPEMFAGGKVFKDVAESHWAYEYIMEASEMGIVEGYPDNTFRPNGNITRAEGIAMIARFAKLKEIPVAEIPFPDVPGRHWAIKYIYAAKSAQMLEYLAGKDFEPNKKLTRAEVAEILSKSPVFKQKVEDMLDWEKGYGD
jgi:hypothetical protein